MTQAEELRRVIDALDAAGAAYMIVGSFASSLWGLPRTTLDADVVVRMTGGQLDALIVGSSRVDLQACKLEYSIVSPK